MKRTRCYERFLPSEACTICKGACCKGMGGSYSPADFEEVSYDCLKSLLEKGQTSIDWWETFNPKFFIDRDSSSDPIVPVFFIRARNCGSPILDPGISGICCHLRDDGCELVRKDMPMQCRTLKPGDLRHPCTNSYDKKECANEWKEYQSILSKLASELDMEMFEAAHKCFLHEKKNKV